MNKFKKILLGTLSVLTLGLFVATGTKANAKTVNNNYSFDISNFSKLSKAATTPSTLTASDGDSGDEMSLSMYHKNVNGDSSYKDSNIEIQDKIAYFDIYFSFTSKGSGKLSFTAVTGGSSKYLYYLIDSDCSTTFDANNPLTEGTNKFANGTVDFDFTGDGDHTVRIYSSSKPGSNFKISAISMTETYDDGQAEATKYDVSYNNNGHGDSVETINVSKLVASSLPELSASGYNFGGWFYDNNTFDNEAGVGDDITEDTVLYAKWTAVAQYAVTYDIDGTTSSSNVNAGTVIALNAAPSKANAVFNGWSDGTTTYAAGSSYTVNAAVTFTATWTTFVGGDSTSFVASDLYGTYPNTISNRMVVDGTIFTIYADSSKTVTLDNNKVTLSDSSTEISGRVKLGGTADFTTPLRVIGFTAPNDGTINVEFVSASDTNSRNLLVKDSSGTQIATMANSSATNAVKLTASVESGKTYYIGSENSGINIAKVEFDETTSTLADNVTASTDAYQNGDKDALRIVGTISGVSNLSTIKSIELVLLKNDTATKTKIFLNTCYISVTGVGTYEEAKNTYYVIYRITGINSTAMPDGTIIKHKLIVTFTDDSYVESTVVPSEWNN